MPENQLAHDAERALLGAILIEGTYWNPLPEIDLTVLDFNDAFHQQIFQAMQSCDMPHIVNVARKLYETGTIKTGTQVTYLHLLVADCPNSLEYESFAAAVKQYSGDRALRMGGKRVNFKGVI